MNGNPSPTIVKAIDFCLATHVRDGETLICTRINDHEGHCCDEIAGEAWTDRGVVYLCTHGYDHSDEKGLNRS